MNWFNWNVGIQNIFTVTRFYLFILPLSTVSPKLVSLSGQQNIHFQIPTPFKYSKNTFESIYTAPFPTWRSLVLRARGDWKLILETLKNCAYFLILSSMYRHWAVKIPTDHTMPLHSTRPITIQLSQSVGIGEQEPPLNQENIAVDLLADL